MARLLLRDSHGSERSFPLEGDVVTLGRTEENSIMVEDSHVSRHHAELRIAGDGNYYVRDLHSSNGTYLNGERLQEPTRLAPGDEIRIGKMTIVYDPMRSSGVRVSTDFEEEDEDAAPVAVSSYAAGDEGTLLGFRIPRAASRTSTSPLEDPANRLKLVYSYADRLRRCLKLDEVLEMVLEAVFEIASPDRVAILMASEETGKYEPAASRSIAALGRNPDGPITVSKSVIRRCVEERRAVIMYSTSSDQRFSESESLVLQGVGSAVCCPLISGDTIHGVLYLDTLNRLFEASDAAVELIVGLANQAAMALTSAVNHARELQRREVQAQLDVARRIHDRLLEDRGFSTPTMRAAVWNRPSHEVGGDYAGVFESSQGPLFAIGDSTGHGIGPSLIMSTARAYLVGTLSSSNPPLPRLMRLLNTLLIPDLEAGFFVSFLLLRVDPTGRLLNYVSAGHEPPLLYRPFADKFVELPPGGIVLGLMDDAEYEEGPETRLQTGDRILMFTDGLFEERNPGGTQFGLDRLCDSIRETASLPPTEAVAAIASRVDQWRGSLEQSDDYTLLLIEIIGGVTASATDG